MPDREVLGRQVLGRQVLARRSVTGTPEVTPGILAAMAKVMISLPDELLARVDADATEAGITRSAALRALAEAALGERQRKLSARMVELQTGVTGHGGNVAAAVKAGRPA